MKPLASRTRALAGTCSVILRDDIAVTVEYLRRKGYTPFRAWAAALDSMVEKPERVAAGPSQALRANRRARSQPDLAR